MTNGLIRNLYVCYERRVYEGMRYYGFFISDNDAIGMFRSIVGEGEWFIGRLDNQFTVGVVKDTLPVVELLVFKKDEE